MALLILIAFFGFAAGSFILLDLSVFDFADGLTKLFHREKNTIKSKVKHAVRKKNTWGIRLYFKETKNILESVNKSDKFIMICIASFFLFIIGALLAITISNMFLLPVLAAGLSLIPFWYVRFIAIRWKKQLNGELETALSVITSSYVRTESIITAIDENITYINPPLQDIFEGFLAQTKLINSNIQTALESLKSRVDNDIFRDWVDAVIACQEDVNLKSTLTPIVSKLSDIRIVSGELDNLLYEPVKEFVTMAILLIGNVPLMYFLNKSWYETLVFNPLGKIILALSSFVIFISLAAVIRISRPVKYRG